MNDTKEILSYRFNEGCMRWKRFCKLMDKYPKMSLWLLRLSSRIAVSDE